MSSSRALMPLAVALLIAGGLVEALAAYLWHPYVIAQAGLHIGYFVATAALILLLARPGRPLAAPVWASWALIGGAFVVTVLLAQVAMEAFPLSADEYGYHYVADTLRHGRLWNQPLPDGLHDLLYTYYIGGRDGKLVSQYPPGWPLLLAAFDLVGIPQFANAVIGLVAAVFLWLALSCLPVPRGVRFAALVFGAACPFALFNDASFFNHALTAAGLLGVVWLDLRDAARPTRWNRFGIGFFFSVLLATRYETFLIPLGLFVLDGLWRRRAGFIAWVLPAAAGAAPVTILFLLYNWRITGSPLMTTLSFVSPDIGYGLYSIGADGPHTPLRGLQHTLAWLQSWQDFAAILLLPLYAVALWHRIASRTLRWFDLLWPALIVFFFLYPDSGGFQYGPRYWYIGHAVMPLTVAAGVPLVHELWRIRQWRLDPLRLALAQLASFAGFTVGFAIFLHLQADVRMAPLRVAAQAPPPALVLMPSQRQRYVSWQKDYYMLLGRDYTRNGVDGTGPVLLGTDLGAAMTATACAQLPDRAVYRLHLDPFGPQASLEPVCNGAVAPPS